LKAYHRLGLILPDLKTFLDEDLQAPARSMKEAAPQELLLKTFAEARVLREKDRNAYVAFLLGVCSLRRGEIQRARGRG